VAAILDQVPRQRLHRVGAQAPAVVVGAEEDVQLGVAVVGLVLLGHLDHPGHPVIDEDREALDRGLVGQREVLLQRPPAVGHLGPEPDRSQRLGVLGGQRSQRHPLAVQVGHRLSVAAPAP